jgi:hypothetical protein
MTYSVRGLGLVSCLVSVLTLTASTLAQSDAQAVTASTTPPTAAYVYIQTQGLQGPVYGFRASSTGTLSPIPGSPFKPAGEIVGGTPTQFFTLGKTLLHSYGVAANGAIESQLGQIPFFDYSGSDCPRSTSVAAGAVLDHTGKYIYVLLGCGGDNLSAEYQTYLIHSDGAFSFDGDASLPASWTEGGFAPGLPSILGNENFAYEDEMGIHAQSVLIGFRRTSAGTLQQMQFTERDPACCGGDYEVSGPDASPTGNYLVFQFYPADTNPPQFASYTVASNGDISSTNTSSNMPRSSLTQPSTKFSPSGDLFVAYSGMTIEIYIFNGAAPLVLRQRLMAGQGIDQVAWDSSDHLYAISNSGDTVYVYTITPASVTQTSSISIGSPFKMVVVSAKSEQALATGESQ